MNRTQRSVPMSIVRWLRRDRAHVFCILVVGLLVCSCASSRGMPEGEIEPERDEGEWVDRESGEGEDGTVSGAVVRVDTVRIHCGSLGAPVRDVLRPGVEVHFFGFGINTLFSQFLQDMRVGLVRTLMEGAFRYSESFADFRRHLSDHDRQIRAAVDHGGQVVIPLFPMPRWLSSVQSEELAPGTPRQRYLIAPPRDYALWEDAVYEVVKHFNRDLGLDLLYEVWNEPESPEFWSGSVREYLLLYRHAVIGARRADPDARVGGPAAGWWSSGRARAGRLLETEGGEALRESLLYQWLAYASSTSVPGKGWERLPIDFVSWHQYGADPSYVDIPVSTIRDWLEAFGYDRETPLIIDEWNSAAPGGPAGISRDPRRTTSYISAYAAAMIVAMERAGLDAHSFFQLRRDSNHDGEQVTGDLGLVTPIGMIKPAYNVFRLISMLDGNYLDTTGERVPSLVVEASRDKEGVCVLLVNFVSEDAPLRRVRRLLAERGYGKEDLVRLGLSQAELRSILQGREDLDRLDLSKGERQDLDAAIAAYEQEREVARAEREVVLEFVDLPYDSVLLCERYVIDGRHGNISHERARVGHYLEELEQASKEPAIEYLRSRGYSAEELSRWSSDFEAAARAYRDARGQRRIDLRTAHDLFRQERRRKMVDGAREINRWRAIAIEPERRECLVGEGAVVVRTTLEPQAVSLIALRPVVASP